MQAHPYDKDAWHLLCVSSIRRLFALRNDPRHGADARISLRLWIADLRAQR